MYPYNQALFNPASAWAEDKHIISAHDKIINYDGEIFNWGVLANYEGNIKKINSGIGAMFRYQKIAKHISEVTVSNSYNYKIKFNENSILRIGIRNTLNQTTLKYDKLNLQNPNDPVFKNETIRKYNLDLGAQWNIGKIHIGISAGNLLKSAYTYSSLRNPYRYFYGNIGKKIKVNNKLKIEPSFALLSGDLKYYQFNLNNKFIFKDIVIIGVTYSQWSDSNRPMLSIQGGVNISDKVELIGLIYSNYNQYSKTSTAHIYEGMVRVKF